MKKLLVVLMTLATAICAGGIRRNVAVGGVSSGNGISTPWNLTYAIAGAGGTIQAGDTMIFAAGTYLNPRSGMNDGEARSGFVAFPITVSTGTANSPVIFRADPAAAWGSVVWDGGNTLGCDIVQFNSPNVWLWGIRITSSDPNKNATINTDGDWSFPNPLEVHIGVGTNFYPGATSGNKLINCIIHDCQEGMGNTNWQSSHDCEFYGVLAFNNGYTAPDRDHGHNVYIQNAAGSIRKITNCVIWGASENNVQAYGSGIQNGQNQYLTMDMNFTGNIIFQTGSDGRNFLLGQGAWQADNNTINNNSMYQSNTKAVFDLGWTPYGGGMSNTKFSNNYVGGRYIQFQSPITGTTGAGNLVWYTDISGSVPSGFQGVTSSKPTTNVVKVYPNLYESGRASVAVFNWQNLSNVPVDLSSIMQNGDTYTIRDAQNPFVVLHTGTYSGPVSVSMTGTTVLQRNGNGNGSRTHTPTEFGAFIVTGGTSAAPAPGAPTSTAATNKTRSGFTANWNAVSGATGYYLDVSTVNTFVSYVSGYQNRDMSASTSATLTGLVANTSYYYRVRAYNAAGTSTNSGTITATTLAGSSYRSAVFLVHSVGSVLYQRYPDYSNLPNATTIPIEVANYNTANGFSGSNAVSMTKQFFPANTPSDNNWYKWRRIVTGADGESGDFNTACTNYPVVIIKTCYLEQQAMSSVDSIAALKTHYRAIVTNLATRSSNYFILWTNYPAGTDGHATRAQYSNLFSRWAKDTLAAGLDSYGAFPTNIYIFDVFHKLASSVDGYCDPIYASGGEGPGGDHPSNAACAILDPLIVSETFNNSLAFGGSGVAIPPAPTANAASNVGANSFTANWGTVGTATGYWLDISTSSSFASYLDSARNVGLVTSYSKTGLTAGTNYYYRVRAYNSAGQSANSSTITVQTAAPPSAPLALAGTSMGATGFTANWNSSGGATGYRLDVSTSNVFASYVSGYQDKSVGSVVNSAVTGLSNSTTYYYRVRATNAAGTSNNSNVITVVTLGVPPNAPVATAASAISASGFTANWNTSAGSTGYYLDVSIVSNFASFVSGYSSKDVGLVLTSAVTGLSSSSTYYYRVRAYNTIAPSGNSNTITVTTLGVAPGAPTATAGTAVGTSTFTANWNTVNGATGYYLDVSTNSGFSSFVSGYSNKDVGLVLSSGISGLSANTAYYYRVRAYNLIGSSGSSNTITVTTAVSAPSAPTATSATTVTDSSLTAHWGAVGGATGYRLDVSLSSVFASFVTGFNNKDVGNVDSASVTGLSPNTVYHFRVRAYNGSGTSPSSNVISDTTLKPVPSAPTASAATGVIDTAFTAHWSASIWATGYYLDVSKRGNFSTYVDSSLDVGNVIAYYKHGLTADSTYYYRVRAYNEIGISANSNVDTLTTTSVAPPPAPVADSAASITTNSFLAQWDTLTAGATSFRLDVSLDPSFGSFVSGFSDLNVSADTSKSVTGLTFNTIYYYRVRCVGTGGTSGNSNVVTVKTLGVTPAGNFRRTIILKGNP